MKSTTRPTSRRTASATTPATWRWCAASLARIPVVLSSATPSLETEVNARRGRYQRARAARALRRPADCRGRGDRSAPRARRRAAASSRRRSPARSQTALERGEQALLFLNRRGYAPLTLCRACGFRFHARIATPGWSITALPPAGLPPLRPLRTVPPPCPECLAAGTLVPCGPGVERVLEEMSVRFPTARPALMVSDMLTGPRAAAELTQAMTERRYDVLIGTQIVAKGHHFPMLTLVGVVDADLGLIGGDLRAAERTYQLLHQVVGRAGRPNVRVGF